MRVSIAQQDQIVRRDGEPPLDGRIILLTEGGAQVRIESLNGPRDVLITWDRIRDIVSEQDRLAEDWKTFQSFAESLWRARARVERGDYALAEPVLDNLFRKTMGRTDASALVVSEGLLRCRLARGAHSLAVLPWLESRRMMQTGLVQGAYRQMKTVIDPVTGLCVDLPPVWAPTLALEKLAVDLETYVPVEAPAIEMLARLYLRSVRQAAPSIVRSSERADLQRTSPAQFNDPGVLLTWAIVAAQSPREHSLSDIDAVIGRYLRETGPLTPWAYFARGSMRSASPDPQERSEGLVELLTVPALFADSASTLSGFALGHAAEILEQMGRHESAASLRRELHDQHPDHPLAQKTLLASRPATEE